MFMTVPYIKSRASNRINWIRCHYKSGLIGFDAIISQSQKLRDKITFKLIPTTSVLVYIILYHLFIVARNSGNRNFEFCLKLKITYPNGECLMHGLVMQQTRQKIICLSEAISSMFTYEGVINRPNPILTRLQPL